MKKLAITLLVSAGAINFCSAQQQQYYDVIAGNGNGLRLWGSDAYKIHMGYGGEYLYGPVTDYSIKTNMSSGTPGRGWTWGVTGQVPVAAINTLGNMQIAGTFTSTGSIGQFYSSNNMGMYTDPWFNLRPQTGATSSNFWNIYHQNGNALFSVWFASAQPYVQLGYGQPINLFVNGSVGIGTTSPTSKLQINGSGGGVTDLLVNGRMSSETTIQYLEE